MIIQSPPGRFLDSEATFTKRVGFFTEATAVVVDFFQSEDAAVKITLNAEYSFQKSSFRHFGVALLQRRVANSSSVPSRSCWLPSCSVVELV